MKEIMKKIKVEKGGKEGIRGRNKDKEKNSN